MRARLLLPAAFLPLAAFGVMRSLEASAAPNYAALETAIVELAASSIPGSSGTFPPVWDSGNDCANEPDWDVHAYNEDLYILRQSKCDIFEAPFLYMIFGEDNVLLLDTGAIQSASAHTWVDAALKNWEQVKGQPAPPLIVAHTHSHGDHTAGDFFFQGKPGVQEVVGLSAQDVHQFWGFQDYPNDMPTIDLGGRVLDVIGTPGHQAESVTLYDRETQLLLTGDIVYPGHLFVFSAADWPVFQDSILRLIQFAATNPVQWVVGCHIEFSSTPYVSYAWGTSVHPDEHPLQMPPQTLMQVFRAAREQGGDPECTKYPNFVIHPVYKCGITWN